MAVEQPEQPEQPELADVVALLLAHLRREQDDAVGLLSSLGDEAGMTLVGEAVSMALEIACRYAPGGKAEVEALLVDWQERRRGSL